MNVADPSNIASVYFSGNQMNAVSGASPYVPPTLSTTEPLISQMRSDIKQNSQDFKALRSALNSNDLTGATQSFTNLQQDIQTASQTAGGKSPFDPNRPIGKDFKALGDALKSGDIRAAKQAFTAFKYDIKSAGSAARAHHHHAAHNGNANTGTQNPSATAAASGTTPASQTVLSVLNTTA
jgi:hypothetical protein